MKFFRFLLPALVLGLTLSACGDLNQKKKLEKELAELQDDLDKKLKEAEPDTREIVINDEYAMDIPNDMKSTEMLNDEASLQYMNAFKENYIIVIDEPTEDLVQVAKDMEVYDEERSVAQNYRDIQLGMLTEEMASSTENDSKTIKLNGMDAELIEMDGQVPGVPYDISYFIAYVHGDDKLYTIMAWTLADRKDKYKDRLLDAIHSFRRVDLES